MNTLGNVLFAYLNTKCEKSIVSIENMQGYEIGVRVSYEYEVRKYKAWRCEHDAALCMSSSDLVVQCM